MTTTPALRKPTTRRLAVALVAAALALSGCVHGKKLSETRGTASSTTIPINAEAVAGPEVERPTTLEGVAVRLEEIGQVDAPVAIVPRPGWPHLTIVERSGRLRQLTQNYDFNRDGQITNVRHRIESWDMLDISRQVDQGAQGGMRAATYSSDGRKLYVTYVSTDAELVVDEYLVGEGDIDTGSRTTMLRLGAPGGLRRGGATAFGRDGFLYVGVGVPDADPGSAQNPDSVWGKVLRLDPEGALGDAPYAIPPGNPYASGGGAGEVWLSGVRDPRGLAFDSATGDLYLTDRYEDMELLVFLPRLQSQAGRGDNLGFPNSENTVGPLVQIFPPDHCDLRQGAVYRGQLMPALRGTYVFGEACAGSVDGVVVANRVVQDQRPLGAALPPGGLGGFGRDNDGEVWVFATSGQVYRILPI